MQMMQITGVYMKYLIMVLLLVGCGGGSGGSDYPPMEHVDKPVIVDKCITSTMYRVSDDPNEVLMLNGLYSLTYSGELYEQNTIHFKFGATSAKITTVEIIQTNGPSNIDFFYDGGFIMSIYDDNAGNNIDITYMVSNGVILSYDVEFNNECEL